MKAKLIKYNEGYSLYDKDGTIATLNGRYVKHKLSRQNCDEIFGIIDVEKLAEESYQKHRIDDKNYSINEQIQRSGGFSIGFEEGFNKAMELNRFTLEQAVEMAKILVSNPFEKSGKTAQELVDTYVKSIQHQTEIDVMIVMAYVGECNGNDDNGCFQDSSGHDCGCFNRQPKLDSQGNLILKKL